MLKVLLMFSPLVLLVMALQQPTPAPAPWSVPPEFVRMTNPVKPTPDSLAKARKMYQYDCAICHGPGGNGRGELAANLQTKPKDWTDPAALSKMSDGELFYIIKNGKDTMPGEGARMTDAGLWNMVSLIRSYGSK